MFLYIIKTLDLGEKIDYITQMLSVGRPITTTVKMRLDSINGASFLLCQEVEFTSCKLSLSEVIQNVANSTKLHYANRRKFGSSFQ